MKSELSGKVAIITGGNRGLGEAMAVALSGAGASIALVARNEEKLASVRDKIVAQGGNAASFVADVTDESQVTEMAAAVNRTLGAPQIVINNAGTNCRKHLTDLSADEFKGVVDSSLTAAFLTSRAFVPGMIGRTG